MVEMRRALLRALAAALRCVERRTPSPQEARRVLVCATGGLGNTVLLLPLLRTLRERLPHAWIDLLLTNRAAFDLAQEAGWTDGVLYVPEREWREGLSAVRFFALSIRRRRYDIVLRTFLTAPAMARASLAAFLSGARIRVAFGDPGANPFESRVLELDGRRAEVDRHLALAEALGLAAVPQAGGFSAPERGREWAASYLALSGWDGSKPLLGIHPGSDPDYLPKRWPAERFGELASLAIRKFAVQPLVLGGPDDGDAVARLLRSAGPGILSARGQDIVQTTGLIARCAIFVSNDSGLMHVASALGVRTLALFGPTDPVKNRPLGQHTQILRLGLACSPCDKTVANFVCGHHDCLKTLSVDRVSEALERLIAGMVHRASPLPTPMKQGRCTG